MKPTAYKTLKTINEKSEKLYGSIPEIYFGYRIFENSTIAELRIYSKFDIKINVDEISYPKDLTQSSDSRNLWFEMQKIEIEINKNASIFKSSDKHLLIANSKTKSGLAAKEAAREAFKISQGNIFLGAASQAKKELDSRRLKISELQAQQKELIKKMRASNSAYLSKKKSEKAEVAQKNSEALASGDFWNADKKALKAYFHPPFDKNFLVDVSERWRAALFLECESESYKRSKGNWGHKLIGTGRGYLCGIDDNGDEWGHVVTGLDQDYDDYGCRKLENSVSEAMAILFNAPFSKMDNASRQGDLLFIPVILPDPNKIICRHCGKLEDWHIKETRLLSGEILKKCHDTDEIHDDNYFSPAEQIIFTPCSEPWEIRESHAVESKGLLRNGRYFKSENPITVTHTSHQPVILEPGEYRLYTLDIPNAD